MKRQLKQVIGAILVACPYVATYWLFGVVYGYDWALATFALSVFMVASVSIGLELLVVGNKTAA